MVVAELPRVFVLECFIWLALPALPVSMLIVSAHVSTSRTNGVVNSSMGGTGGNAFNYRCPLGSYIIGWDLQAGSYVDGLTAYCGTCPERGQLGGSHVRPPRHEVVWRDWT
jgi:hypothetical protein